LARSPSLLLLPLSVVSVPLVLSLWLVLLSLYPLSPLLSSLLLL
jgi:hypothetical protein